MVQINIEIKEDLHKKARLQSITEGTSLKDFVIRSLKNKLKNG